MALTEQQRQMAIQLIKARNVDQPMPNNGSIGQINKPEFVPTTIGPGGVTYKNKTIEKTASDLDLKSKITLKKLAAKLARENKIQEEMTSPMSGESSKIGEIAASGLLGTMSLEDMVNDSSFLDFLAPSITNRKLDAKITTLSNLMGRLESGGAIAKEELEMYKNLVPSFMDSKGVKIDKLKELKRKFYNIGTSVMPKDRFEQSYKSGLEILKAGKTPFEQDDTVDPIKAIDDEVMKIDKQLGL